MSEARLRKAVAQQLATHAPYPFWDSRARRPLNVRFPPSQRRQTCGASREWYLRFTLIISIHEGWVGAAREPLSFVGADFADLAVFPDAFFTGAISEGADGVEGRCWVGWEGYGV